MNSATLTALESPDNQDYAFSCTIDIFPFTAADYFHLPATARTGILLHAPNEKHLHWAFQLARILLQ